MRSGKSSVNLNSDQNLPELEAMVKSDPSCILAEEGNLIQQAARFNDLSFLKILLTYSQPEWIDHTDSDGRTPMHWAFIYASPRLIQSLIQAGSRSVNIPDRTGSTPLHLAMHYRDFESPEEFKFLLRLGIDSIDLSNADEFRPMDYAIQTLGLLESALIAVACSSDVELQAEHNLTEEMIQNHRSAIFFDSSLTQHLIDEIKA